MEVNKAQALRAEIASGLEDMAIRLMSTAGNPEMTRTDYRRHAGIAQSMFFLIDDLLGGDLHTGGNLYTCGEVLPLTPNMIDAPPDDPTTANHAGEDAPKKRTRKTKKSADETEEMMGLPDEEPTSGVNVSEEDIQTAAAVIFDSGLASIAQLQRSMKVGYAVGSALLDKLEEMGVISAFDGSKPRTLLMTQAEWNAMHGSPDAINEPQPDESPAEEAPVDTDVTLEDLRAKLRTAQTDGKLTNDQIREVFQKHGVNSLTAFPAKHYGELLALIEG